MLYEKTFNVVCANSIGENPTRSLPVVAIVGLSGLGLLSAEKPLD